MILDAWTLSERDFSLFEDDEIFQKANQDKEEWKNEKFWEASRTQKLTNVYVLYKSIVAVFFNKRVKCIQKEEKEMFDVKWTIDIRRTNVK